MNIRNFEENQRIRLQELIKNPQKAVALQSAISGEASRRMLKRMRQVLGARNVYDQIELSQEILRLLDEIQKNDYFLFLVLIDRFDLIFEVFYKESFLKTLGHIRALQNEKKKNERRYYQNLELLQKKISELYKKKEEHLNETYQVNSKIIEAHLDLFNYFLISYLEITHQFYAQQIETYEEDYQVRVDLMKRTIIIFQENNMLTEANELTVLLENYQEERNTIEQINIFNVDNSINIGKQKEKYEKWENSRLEHAPLFRETLQKYALPEITLTLKKAEENDLKYETILVKTEKKYHENLSKVMPGLEPTIALLKRDISDGMTMLKKELNSLDTKTLSEEERKELYVFIEHLEKSEQLIQKIKNPLEIQSAIQKVITDIKDFESNHAISFLKSGALQKFEQLKSILIQVNKGILIKGLPLNHSNSLENKKNSHHGNENNIILPELIDYKEINIQKTKDFHEEIRKIVEHNGKSENEKAKEDMIDEEKKSLLDKSIESLIVQLNKIKKESDFDAAHLILALVESHSDLKNDFSQETLDRVIKALDDLADNLEDFEETQEDVNNVRYELKAFKDELNNTPALKI